MFIPELKPINWQKEVIREFGGIDNLNGAPFSTFKDSQGLILNKYNTLETGFSTRDYYLGDGVSSLGTADGLYFFQNGELNYNGNWTGLCVSSSPTAVLKFSEFIVVFPEKKAYNTETEEVFSLENTFEGEARFIQCSSSGEEIEFVTSHDKPLEAEYWCDTTDGTPVLKRFASGSFYTVESPLVKLSAEGIGEGFKVGDSVKLSALTLGGEHIIKEIGEDYILLGGVILKNTSGEITLKREIPDITYAHVFGNRIWGTGRNGTEIYASALGSVDSFYCFEGTSADSYTVSLRDTGKFRGIGEYEGALYFFKEDRIYALFGSRPSNFQIKSYMAEGIYKEGLGSVVYHKGYLYYISRFGLMRFDGSASSAVCLKLSVPLKNCSLSSNGEELFFLSNGSLYEVKTQNFKVLRLYEGEIRSIVYHKGMLYFETERGIGYFLKGERSECFMVEFNSSEKEMLPEAFIKRLKLFFSLGEGSFLRVEVSYDNEDFKTVSQIKGKAENFSLPIPIRRHKSFRLRLSGEGLTRIYGLEVYKCFIKGEF